ncbi:uncharacterized protein B0P05DRAFT_277287 [Gilbertella persicaria]|uniref:uncharacterized protein n=1 Tax=Gilbertella persicaria TaxID=101096 RepID=UPI00221E9779|nr:uncharacterized protein B0P05DRAFT_277287 [Gilbertella persicaria]KAI8058968.1 hypothetical protein B0P05DRAFT_277287 [Gilbertella persicaria]
MDRKWTDSIVVLISPAVYISCLLTILIATTSVVVTWSVYHVHMPTLNVGWWLFYLLTICSFLNDCVYLGISSTTKEQFISDCISDAIVAYHQGCGSSANTTSSCQNIVPVPSISDCKQSWAFVVIQFSIVTILDLVINLIFAYVLYRFKTQCLY